MTPCEKVTLYWISLVPRKQILTIYPFVTSLDYYILTKSLFLELLYEVPTHSYMSTGMYSSIQL